MLNTVLVVDDYATSLQIWVLILQKHGYKTLEATKAYMAIDIARKYVPNLILCDFILGG
jgi:PleD family two-component response regulator